MLRNKFITDTQRYLLMKYVLGALIIMQILIFLFSIVTQLSDCNSKSHESMLIIIQRIIVK